MKNLFDEKDTAEIINRLENFKAIFTTTLGKNGSCPNVGTLQKNIGNGDRR